MGNKIPELFHVNNKAAFYRIEFPDTYIYVCDFSLNDVRIKDDEHVDVLRT